MIPPRNRWYRDALASGGEAYSRVEVWRGGLPVEELAPRDRGSSVYALKQPAFGTGSVRATLGSRVTRTLSVEVPRYLFPRKPSDLLAPFGNELRVFKGLRYGNGSADEFPVFVGPITHPRPPQNGRVVIEAADVSWRVAGAGFFGPTASQAGFPVADEFQRLVLDAYPQATFGPSDTFTELVPALAYDSDPGQALDNLAKSANAFWYALADGRFVMRRVPWTVAPSSGPLVMHDGPGGTVQLGFPDFDVSGLVNQVTIISDRADGGQPLWATAQDTDPASPTYVLGPFGRRATSLRVTGATNQGQLFQLAETIIQRTRSLANSWQIVCTPDAAMELGDPLDVTADGERTLQVVAGFTMPLEPTANMTIDGRGVAVGLTEDL